MKYIHVRAAGLALAAVVGFALEAEVRPLVVEGAPFPLTVAEWTPPARDFPVTDYGAKPDGTPCTEAIEAAVAAAEKAGGGRVVLPKGEWISGAFRLKSNVALVVEKGAVLHFPDDPVLVMRAPLRPDGRPTMTHGALIGANGCTNVAILGTGTIKSDVAYWHDNFMKNPQRGWGRPQVIHFSQCRNVRLEGFKVRGSPAWTMHFKVCEDVVMRGVDSVCTGPNTDGLDLESCNRVLVEDCSLDQTDDTYTIKSGFNEAGRKRNIPTQNVVIRNCRAVHGHTLLGIGSEVSGGIRNIYMANCTVESECWRFLYVKTNCKRGAFVENVWVENVRGVRAAQAVFETEMYYDGNPNKELTKKGGPTWPTRIENVHVKNVVCAEAGFAVKVRGDPELPPKGLHAENFRIGRIRQQPVKVSGAPAPDVKDVREDPSALREIVGVPPQVRACEPARDADGAVCFDRAALEPLSFNEICRRVLEGRIAAEVARGRNVAPRVTPSELPPGDVTFSQMFSRRIDEMLRDAGCAVSGAWIADDVRRVARVGADGRTAAFPGVTFTVAPDPKTGDLTVKLVNGGTTPLADIWCVVHLPPEWLTRRRTFRVAQLAPGGTFERTFPMGAGAHTLPRPVGPAPYAAEVDFTCAGVRSRLWTTAETPARPVHPNLSAAALHAGPMDRTEADDEMLLRLSSERGALPPLGAHPRAAWRSPAFPGAAWYNASPLPRPYTPAETRLLYAGRAYEVVAVQFEAPTNTTTILRATAPVWTRDAVVFLNGERIPLTSKTQKIPARAGFNRMIVKYPCKPGKETGLLQLSVYPWDASTCWPCVEFLESTALSAGIRTDGRMEFPLEWNVRNAAGPYEVEISPAKLEKLAGMKKGTGFAVRAQTPAGERELPVAVLPGKAEGTVDLRFTPPPGTTGLVCRAAGERRMSDPAAIDNLFADALVSTNGWRPTPRMIIEPQKGGALLFRPRSGGCPEAAYDVAVPAGLAGRPVKFEAITESIGGASWVFRMYVEQRDASGKQLPEPVYDRRWTTLMMPSDKTCRFVERGRIHPEARTLRFFLSLGTAEKKYDEYGLPRAEPARALTKLKLHRLALRPAEQLPFPKYADTHFPAGVSGEAGDCAIRLGGPDERAFWYQTRSMASWAAGFQLRREERLFFPAGAGTVEAWLKSDWKPTVARANGKDVCRPIVLFQAYQSFRAYECKAGKGAMLQLAYRPDPGELELVLVDVFKTKYTGTAARKLPVGGWCHLAVQWAPGGVAEVFVDGRRALSVPIPNWKALNLADEEIKVPNDENALEFYLGSTWQSARADAKSNPDWPFFQGAADLLRVSTGCRYAGDFTPPRTLACDPATRALFTFDRSFDGVSGGGIGWIPGTTRSLSVGRVDRTLEIGGRAVPYWPKDVPPELDPHCVFDIVNFPVLPTPADFEAARRPFAKSAVLKSGEKLELDCPEKVVTDFVEIANVSDKPLVYPIVLNAGDVDPRSFGDLADTLGLEGLSDRERVDRTFAFVLASTDYFMNHTAMFPPGSDAPRDVEYQALLMLNGYCGFECGPLNNMTANLFVDVAKCPAANTSGYGHSFEQVFYDGKNHIYDLSAQKYFPAADNETAAYLEEGGDESGIFPRMGNAAEHYIRKSTRGVWPGSPANGEKIGVTLNPGEAFRVWQVNDGHCNDLVTRSKTGVYRGRESKFRPDYTEPCHADTEKAFLQRVERFFPQYLNGFITFDGAPSTANPAFEAAADGGAFCYKVTSGGYPIVHAEYAAVRRDGSRAALEISTDGGKTFRPLASPADYAVRARYAYLVRVKAPIGDVARFTASTEVQLNPRVFPGRLRAGANRLTFTCASGGAARVTVQGRAPAGRIAVPEAVSSGAIVGAETLFYAFDPAERPVLDVEGASALATVKAFGGIRATLRDGKLALAADAAGGTRVGAVRIVDGGAEKTLVVLVGTGVRFGTARHARVADGARMLPPDATSPQARGWLPAGNHGAEIRFPIAPVPAGKYAVLCLDRFESHPKEDPKGQVRMLWGDMKSTDLGSARNWACNYKKANYGRPGERANFKWDYADHPGTSHPYANMRVADLPAADRVSFRSWRNGDAVEIAAVLVVPDPSMDLRCELTRVLCGLNCDPWRMQ